MKTVILTMFLLSGCSSECPDCLTMTPAQLLEVTERAWLKGYGNGYNDGEAAAELKRLKSI